MHLLIIFLGLLLTVGSGPVAWAASAKAEALRKSNGLVAYSPSEKFLAGNFLADEINPTLIFGPVKAFAASRKCSTTWLIEAAAPNRAAAPASPDAPMEYTLFLEEDCPGKVVYYVFIDQSGPTPQQWYDYRRKFHGQSKTEPQFGAIKAKLEQACQAGCGIGAELRFIQKNGELLPNSPEKVLVKELKFAPMYDLSQQKKIAK